MKSLKQGVSQEWLLKGGTNDEQVLVQCTVRVPTAGLQRSNEEDPVAGVDLGGRVLQSLCHSWVPSLVSKPEQNKSPTNKNQTKSKQQLKTKKPQSLLCLRNESEMELDHKRSC